MGDILNAFFAFETTVSQAGNAFGVGLNSEHFVPANSLTYLEDFKGIVYHVNVLLEEN